MVLVTMRFPSPRRQSQHFDRITSRLLAEEHFCWRIGLQVFCISMEFFQVRPECPAAAAAFRSDYKSSVGFFMEFFHVHLEGPSAVAGSS